MKNILFWLVSLAVIILQIGLMSSLRPFGVVPNAILVLIVVVGLQARLSQSLIIAVVGGLALDMTSGANFGLRLVLCLLVALTTGLVRRTGVTLLGPSIALIIVAVSTLVIDAGILISVANLAGYWPVGRLVGLAGIEVLLNLLLVLILHPIYRKLTAERPEIMVAI